MSKGCSCFIADGWSISKTLAQNNISTKTSKHNSERVFINQALLKYFTSTIFWKYFILLLLLEREYE